MSEFANFLSGGKNNCEYKQHLGGLELIMGTC